MDVSARYLFLRCHLPHVRTPALNRRPQSTHAIPAHPSSVGFGDFSPTHTSTQILLFPFALLGIAALGSLLDVIVRFFSARSAKRKAASRARLEHARQEDEDAKQDPADLPREIEFLEHLNGRQDAWDQAIEFALSFGGFLAFWFVGAAIFSAIEVCPDLLTGD